MKDMKKYFIRGILFVSVLGTLLHFTHDLSDKNFFIGLFTPINESIWEHTKLIFFPMIFYSVYLKKKLGNQRPCTRSATNFSAVLGVILIITLFYTYSGIIGFNIALADILIFYIATVISFFTAYKLTISCKSDKFNGILQFLIILMIGLYIIFTTFPPEIPLFISP